MHKIYKAQIRTVSGDYIVTQNCNIITSNLEWSRQMIYAELQPDFFPEIIVVDIYYISVNNNHKEKFILKDKITSFNKKIHKAHGMQEEGWKEKKDIQKTT